ncbi:MAG: hypothetical protein KY464_07325 [Gemmatimonadetes bacterium]|nr:hypothetical protein [Gemmatimonadota bacterium]
MMHEENELRRDPEIAAALRMIEIDPPVADVDWDALRSSIVARAELPLAQRRKRSAQLSRWTRPLIPLAAAASIALAAWVNGEIGPAPRSGSVVADNADLVAPGITPEDVFQADVSEQEFRLIVSGRANTDALLQLAVQDES